ncbi:MAG: hypothetical protein ACLUF9_06305 [Oscillospiraceae bacterium]
MNFFSASLVIFFTLCFGVLIFFLGLWVGKLVALDKKEKKRCGYSCSDCEYWPCHYLLCEIEQQHKENPRHRAGE